MKDETTNIHYGGFYTSGSWRDQPPVNTAGFRVTFPDGTEHCLYLAHGAAHESGVPTVLLYYGQQHRGQEGDELLATLLIMNDSAIVVPAA